MMERRGGGAAAAARGLLASAVVAALVVLARPALGAEAETFQECVDEAFAGYNACLMESDGWFHRKLCDISWELEVAVCAAEKVGEVRRAWNGGAQ